MKTIIYGGAFNPPTLAHQTILNACTELAKEINGQVWLLPSGNRTDKTIPIPNETRLLFLEAMIEATPHPDTVTIETLELHQIAPVETFDTIQTLNILHPEHEFHWVFGTDSTATMQTWKQGEWIMENTHILAIQRTGFPINPNLSHYTLLQLPETAISSTEVRLKATNGEDYSNLIIPTMHPLIQNIWAPA